MSASGPSGPLVFFFIQNLPFQKHNFGYHQRITNSLDPDHTDKPANQDLQVFHSALTLYLIETPFNLFGNRADPDQAALA